MANRKRTRTTSTDGRVGGERSNRNSRQLQVRRDVAYVAVAQRDVFTELRLAATETRNGVLGVRRPAVVDERAVVGVGALGADVDLRRRAGQQRNGQQEAGGLGDNARIPG